ncbi:MAG: histone deacetylase family protein [Limibacillus sp.]
MLTVHTEKHRLRASKTELYGGVLVPPFECPERVEIVMNRIQEVGLGEVIGPDSFGLDPIRRIHQPDFLDFLANCWSEWQAAGFKGEAIAPNWPARRMVQRPPNHIDGKIGYYALATESSISEGTWEAALASAEVALTARRKISEGARSAFALCRPPGHHATYDMYGGYCFLNNVAIAAQAWLVEGAERIAILDVDFHHGNGTQDIFYERDDVLFLSLHGEPENAFPYFLGYANETGSGKGEGYNVNYPLPENTGFERWSECLEDACKRISRYAPDALIVSLGVDTYKEDPISFFKLDSDDYLTYGERIGKLGLPTLFCFEGGYAVQQVGINAVNVLEGFEQA